VGKNVLNGFIDRLAGLDHQHNAPRAFEVGNHFLYGMCADYFGVFGFVGQKVVNLA